MGFIFKVLKHKWYVMIVGRKLGLSWWRIITHDLSKFSCSEFWGYYKKNKNPLKDYPEYDRAWIHHQNFNDHHWQYWINRGFNPKPVMPLEMPEQCVYEMVADWFAAAKAYEGTWPTNDKIWPWFDNNWHKIILHYETRVLAGNLITYLLGKFRNEIRDRR